MDTEYLISQNLHWLDSKLQQTALFFKRLFKLDSRIACRAAFKKEIQKIDWFIQLFYPQNRPSLKNLEMSSFNSRPNSIRMHCPNCFSQMETRVEIVSRWFGPFAALWNKFLFFVVYSTFTLDLTKIGQWFWPIMHILELMDLITDTPVPIAITNFNKSSPLRVQYMLCTSNSPEC